MQEFIPNKLPLQKYEEERIIRTKFNRILNRIRTEANKVIENIYRGMTKPDVQSLIDSPLNGKYSDKTLNKILNET